MYDHTKQYRCPIIRGKSQKDIDDLLPAYAKVVEEVCPCKEGEFKQLFNDAFQRYLPESKRIEKTLDNHRTEIAGKLFGMYFHAEDGMVYESERTQKFLADNDQPAFFKDICYKMQFPSGTQQVYKIEKQIEDNICVRPNAFLLKLLEIAESKSICLTKREIGYYVLNALDVLQGQASPEEVLKAILQDREKGIKRTIKVPGKANSYNWQHITEQLNYLELANLIHVGEEVYGEKEVHLNKNEKKAINRFAADWDKKPDFDVYAYPLNTPEQKRDFQYAWDAYFAQLSPCVSEFETSVEALVGNIKKLKEKPEETQEGEHESLVKFGDEGEQIVYIYEKNRVKKFNVRLANKVLSMGKTKGLGYDIQSVIAQPGDQAEFVKYIEVKSTKRVTCPDKNDTLWIDTLNITRNEWVAAQQHHEYYAIYRVYFTREGVSIFVLEDPWRKSQEGKIQVTPMTYRVEFSSAAVDNVLSGLQKESL